MPISRDLVLSKARQIFPTHDETAVLTMLQAYGAEPHEADDERVYLAILKLCDEAGASDPSPYVTRAKRDPRDVIAWAEYPNQMAFGPTDDPVKAEELRKSDDDQYRAWLAKTR